MAESYFPFEAGAGAAINESQWRDLSLALGGGNPGVIDGFENELQAFGDSTAGVVKLRTGRCVCYGHYYVSTSEISLAVANNGTGQRRVDQVVIEFDFVNNLAAAKLILGGVSPTPLTQDRSTKWQVLLAYVLTPAGANPIISSGVVIPCLDRYALARMSIPIGAGMDFYLKEAVAPGGFLLADGKTYSSWALPKMRDIMLFTSQGLNVAGSEWGLDTPNEQIKVPDRRGRVGVGVDNMGGSDADRIQTLTIASVTLQDGTPGLGRTGGASVQSLVSSTQLPSHAHSLDGAVTATESASHVHGVSDPTYHFTVHKGSTPQAGYEAPSPGNLRGLTNTQFTGPQSANHIHGFSGQATQTVGSSAGVPNMPPYLQCNHLVRVA